MLRSLVLAAFALFCGCARQAAPPPPPLVEHDVLAAPFTVQWAVRESSEGRVVLVARIDKTQELPAPLQVTVQVPDGATLERGPREYQLGVERGVDEKVFVVAFPRPPAEDLVLAADVRTVSFTAHGEDRFRFGRPAPQSPMPVADGPEIEINGKKIGRPVMAR